MSLNPTGLDVRSFEPITETCIRCAPTVVDLKQRLRSRIEQLERLQTSYNRLADAARDAGLDVIKITRGVEIGPRIEATD